ncbi:hypothetical protein BB561_004828 [Smittium simulii]|uniref:Arginine N-methyltransferase 2 n=1 Tax=Smittium simulii TaxID=133385 RepID=A0A2T9YDX8_9FUNG|nr:hypothetical protein BB561_004828 [Smittium simulii]
MSCTNPTTPEHKETETPAPPLDSLEPGLEELLSSKLLNASFDGNSQLVSQLLKQGADVFCGDETGRTPLHFAAASGDIQTMKLILDAGLPWNVLDQGSYTAGDYALQTAKSTSAYNYLVDFGYQTELVFKTTADNTNNSSRIPISNTTQPLPTTQISKPSQDSPSNSIPNEDYLNSSITYQGDRLIDSLNNGVMMEWEEPIMEHHAKAISHKPSPKVLNIGFGMGIIDSKLQNFNPSLHVIVEAHPDVYKYMLDNKWHQKPNVKILFGRWQDCIQQIIDLGPFDGIFFDTFGEFYADLLHFHKVIFSKSYHILASDGVYSFFNGLGGDSLLFHDVYCKVAKYDLTHLNVNTVYAPITVDLDSINEKTWENIRRPYWMLQQYNLPICTWSS